MYILSEKPDWYVDYHRASSLWNARLPDLFNVSVPYGNIEELGIGPGTRLDFWRVPLYVGSASSAV